jgi:hypothetical protein
MSFAKRKLWTPVKVAVFLIRYYNETKFSEANPCRFWMSFAKRKLWTPVKVAVFLIRYYNETKFSEANPCRFWMSFAKRKLWTPAKVMAPKPEGSNNPTALNLIGLVAKTTTTNR